MALPDHLPDRVRAAILDLKEKLVALYGERLRDLILYGSYARGEATPDSDVDLLAVIDGPYQFYTELRRMGVVTMETEFTHDLLLSVQPYTEEEIANPANLFMQNVRKDAVAV